MSLKTTGLERTASSEPGNTKEQDRAPDLNNELLHSQTEIIRSSPRKISVELSTNLPTNQSDEILERQEQLARKRQFSRIRREKKRHETGTKMRNISKMRSRNDNLRRENQVLIQELATYGVIYSGVQASTANQTTSVLETTSTITLQHMIKQQSAVMQENAARIARNGSRDLNSQPLRNEGNGDSITLPWLASTRDTLLSCTNYLREVDQRYLQQRAAALSLIPEMTRKPSTHLMQALNVRF